MRRLLIWSFVSVLSLAAGFGLFALGYWTFSTFWPQPSIPTVSVQAQQDDIQRLLDEASWLAPGAALKPVEGERDRRIYIVASRENPGVEALIGQQIPAWTEAGMDVRVVAFAPADENGEIRSSAADRSTVAELWLTRDWSLFQRWMATPVDRWTAAGLPSADDMPARAAVVEAGRNFAQRLTTLTGRAADQPLVLWRDAAGIMQVCACGDARAVAAIAADLGVVSPEMEASEPAPEAMAETVKQAAPAAAPVANARGQATYPKLPAPRAETPARTSEAAPASGRERGRTSEAMNRPKEPARPRSQANPPAAAQPERARERAAPNRSSANRPAQPRPQRTEDTLFF